MCIRDRARPGQIVGIVGGTGCGKSSLVNLIPRLYDATQGEVLVDGVNVKKYDLKALREMIGVVLQKNVLFSGTIEENIRWGKKDATHEEIVAACKAAQADSFINEQPDGYNTYLAQGGLNLSGGQKQRLCIARAMAVSPSVLLMDEPASALDPISTAKVEELIHELKKDYTIVIVTHNMQQAARVSDKTAFFYLGEMVEYGDTKRIFTNPEKEATQNYITGRFG